MQQQIQDTDIIRSVLQGDKKSYAILVERYRSYVFTLVGRLINNREDAEDVAQEVFVKAYLSLAGFKGTSKFSTWLYSIAHTTAISHLRKKQLNTRFADDEQLANYLDRHQNTSTDIAARTRKEAMDLSIKQLSPTDAEVVTLFYLADQSLEEIAAIMNMETNTVKVKLHRARQKLKDIVERNYGSEASTLYKN